MLLLVEQAFVGEKIRAPLKTPVSEATLAEGIIFTFRLCACSSKLHLEVLNFSELSGASFNSVSSN